MSSLSLLIRTLRIAESIADASPVPGVKLIISTALTIAETAESVKQNKGACVELAERAARLSLSVCEELRDVEKHDLDGNLVQRITTLQCALDKVQVLVKKAARKSLLKRILKVAEIQAEVDRLTKELESAVDAFSIRSLVSVDHKLSLVRRGMDSVTLNQLALARRADDAKCRDLAILRGNDNILAEVSRLSQSQVLYDGAFRLYGRDDLVLELDPDPQRPYTNPYEDTTMQTYRARLRQDNRKVHVVRYCRPEQYHVDIMRLKKNWHPNVRPLLGYSRPDPVASFIVTDAHDSRPWEEVLVSVQGSTRIRYYLQALIQSYSTFSYLVSDLGYCWQRDRTYASLNQYPLVSDSHGNLIYDIQNFWHNLPCGFILNPWAPYHKVHSYIYEDELKQLVLPTYKRSPWAEEQHGDDTAYHSYLEQLYQQWLLVRAFCCTDTQWSLDTIPFPGDVFTGIKHVHSPRSAPQLTHFPEPDSELDSVFPLLAHGTLTFTSNSCEYEMCEINGWNRYTITSLQDDDYPWQPGWHAYYCFGEGSPRREYDLGYVRLPIQQYLLENIFSLSARHGIHDPTKLCLAVTPILYIDTRCSHIGAGDDKTWYLFIRSGVSREIRLDRTPWAYWSSDSDDVPPVLPGTAGEPPPGWTPRNGGTLAYRQYLQDVDAYHEHQWTQTVGETTFEIGLRVRVEYVQLLKEEVAFMRELETCRSSADRIVEVDG
ncbi:hypothetical protein C8T65DRAFT_737276 [Cerioporus squamosus]|nr:hypothetical protein C8T65DRAFT_737276 [Cerioporus squamosus]